MIFIGGISIALFISALLLVKKDKSESDKFLFLWMILIAGHITFFYLLHTKAIYNYPFLLGIQFPFPLLHGVFLYYYVASVTNKLPQNKMIRFSHLIPSLITFVYLIPFFLLSSERKIEIFKNNGENYANFQLVLMIGVFISGIIYVAWSSLMLQKHKKQIRNQFSNIEEINLEWLRLLIYGLGTVWILIILSQNDTLIFTSVSIFVILVGFFGVQQKNIFLVKEKGPKIIKEENPIRVDQAIKEKYINSGLSEENELKYYDRLNKIITHEKIYTNPELSLKDLALKLDIHPNYLSQIINKKESKNFYDYINAYRVEEFKRLVKIPGNQKFTLMAIAYDCGFNSKSSFNRYFKKITNQTPSQYVKGLML